MGDPEKIDDEELLFYLVYCSRAAKVFEPRELDELVSAARRKNADLNITGWLVHSSGIFFQWLEGQRASVKRLMTDITEDPRHNSVVVLSEEEEMRERLFASWDMELVPAEDIREVLLDAIRELKEADGIGALRRLLQELDSKAIGTHS